MRLVRLAALCTLLTMLAAGCADSDSNPSGAGILPQGYNRSHSSIDDYGRTSGFTDPYACWRSTAPVQCY
jgi:hypothetical protein